MLLKRIALKNFRQFYGEQEIVISSDPSKNVTLIHAENGVGKTTFLNAVLWCFYKTTTARFENPEKIVNNEAADEDNFEVSVEVLFEHEGLEYQVKRLINEKYNDEIFTAFQIDNGNYVKIDNPNIFIDSVVPREMARYFFFDGEYAETFSSQNNKSAVRTAVESMLGCDIALSALKDLRVLSTSLEKELASLTKGDQSSIWQDKMDSLQSQNDKDQSEIVAYEVNLATAEEAQNEIMEKLRNSEGARDIQERRDKLILQLAKTTKLKNRLDAQVVAWINKNSIGLISSKLIETSQEVIKAAHIKGLMPSRIAENFVHQIVEAGSCICGRHFESGSAEEGKIKGLLSEAGTALVDDRLIYVRTKIENLNSLKCGALQAFSDIQAQLQQVRDELSQIEQEIEECGLQLQGSNISEIAEREKALENRKQEIKELIEKITRLKTACETRDETINEARQKRDRLLITNSAAQGLAKKRLILEATIEKLNLELENYRAHSRESLVSKVDEILKKAARRDYYVQINDQFNLDMFYGNTTRAVSKSSGENQLLSLAFIASLIGFAAERKNDTSKLLKPGTTAPLLLDSPFGQLDPSYRKSTAAFLPGLAEQVILLVSKSQGDLDVIDALGDRVGSEYVLISENKGHQGDKPHDVIRLKNADITCSLYNCEKTLTRIQKVA